MYHRVVEYLMGRKKNLAMNDSLIKLTSVVDGNKDIEIPLTAQNSPWDTYQLTKTQSVEGILILLCKNASELSDFSLGFLEFCHPLVKLGKNEPISSHEESVVKYHKLTLILDMIDEVSEQLKIIQKENYDWLFDDSISRIKLIDLETVRYKIINMEIFWMSLVVLNGSLKNVASEELKGMASLLLQEFKGLLGKLKSMKNMKNGFTVETSFIMGSCKKSETAYTRGGILKYLKKSLWISEGELSEGIYQRLKDFEYVYRNFEECLLKTCMSFENLV